MAGTVEAIGDKITGGLPLIGKLKDPLGHTLAGETADGIPAIAQGFSPEGFAVFLPPSVQGHGKGGLRTAVAHVAVIPPPVQLYQDASMEHGRNEVLSTDNAAGHRPGIKAQRLQQRFQQGVEFKAEAAAALYDNLVKHCRNFQRRLLVLLKALEILKGNPALMGQQDFIQGFQAHRQGSGQTQAVQIGVDIGDGGVQGFIHNNSSFF